MAVAVRYEVRKNSSHLRPWRTGIDVTIAGGKWKTEGGHEDTMETLTRGHFIGPRRWKRMVTVIANLLTMWGSMKISNVLLHDNGAAQGNCLHLNAVFSRTPILGASCVGGGAGAMVQ